jgi:apolipoprotein D and lipocalin family protein
MKRLSILALVCGLLALVTGCATLQSGSDATTNPVPYVDIEQFMGDWHVIALVPGLDDKTAVAATQSFERALDGTIKITYRYRPSSASDRLTEATSTGRILNIRTNAEWAITRAWPLRSTWQVVHIEDDYSLAMMASGKRILLLSRTPDIAAPRYSDLMLGLQAKGFDIATIRRVPRS